MPRDQRTDAEALVRSLDDRERAATLKRDLPALEELWSEDFTVNAPNYEVVVGRRALLDGFVHSGIINFSRFDRHIEYACADGPFVILMGLEIVQPVNDAPSVGLVAGQEVRRRFTNIWKNEAGAWRLYARHANVIPNR
jgi:ketosteroid isomerase-like protein